MIREVYELGWIESRRGGSTGVGYTLESCLGIEANSSPLPDFEGIEIKAQRHSTKKTRANLFAKVADWDISRLSSSKEILMNYGYVHDEGLKLYCTVSSAHPNSQGLMLEVDNSTNLKRIPSIIMLKKMSLNGDLKNLNLNYWKSIEKPFGFMRTAKEGVLNTSDILK